MSALASTVAERGATEASRRRGPRSACRSCGGSELEVFLSLGELPLPDALLGAGDLRGHEPRYPLDVAFCPECTLVQTLEDISPRELFVENYLYFSSVSDQLEKHSREHAHRLIEECGLNQRSLVVEIASNDGYLLRHFARGGVPVLGIEPAPQQAEEAESRGIPTVRQFFGRELAQRLRAEGHCPDVVIANNVLAHTPEPNDFVEGLAILIADNGLATIENTYVRDLIDRCEFDTIYHEHFSYFSCSAIDALLKRHGLSLQGIEAFPDLQGGTLRWRVGRKGQRDRPTVSYLAEEAKAGLTEFTYYRDFGARVSALRTELLELLHSLRASGARIAAYGAAAKGSTLLNYCGIGTELIEYVVDRNVRKQGLYMPGVHVPIRDPAVLVDDRPDFLLLLAWNYEAEISVQQADYRSRGGRFIVPVPSPRIT